MKKNVTISNPIGMDALFEKIEKHLLKFSKAKIKTNSIAENVVKSLSFNFHLFGSKKMVWDV